MSSESAKTRHSERRHNTREPGLGTMVIAISVVLFTAAVGSAIVYGLTLALRVTQFQMPVSGYGLVGNWRTAAHPI